MWFLATIGGLLWLVDYASAPGSRGEMPACWPPACSVPRTMGRPTLVMGVHPKCPCTYASVSELARVMAGARGAVDAVVLLYQPRSQSEEWSDTRTARLAAAIPGVRTQVDPDGAQARIFGIETSGHVVLYGATGTLAFSGGITPARGHEGDNAGREAILASLAGRIAQPVATAVFGCELGNPGASTMAMGQEGGR